MKASGQCKDPRHIGNRKRGHSDPTESREERPKGGNVHEHKGGRGHEKAVILVFEAVSDYLRKCAHELVVVRERHPKMQLTAKIRKEFRIYGDTLKCLKSTHSTASRLLRPT